MHKIKLAIITFFKRLFNIKTWYTHQGGVYEDNNGNPVEGEITDVLRWKEVIKIKAYSFEESCDRAFEMFHFKYPELKDKIWLF